MRRIETERLILRPLKICDAADVFEWVSDPIVNRYMPYSLYHSVRQVEKWISSLEENENEFGFVLKTTGKVIGAGSVHPTAEPHVCELGYNLNRSYWGKGYATEAARGMIAWAYRTLGIHDFTASHATANTASGNVIRKCGFQFVRYGQYSRFDGSEAFDASFYRMHLD